MVQRFGSLNKDEGERRLNVAITRARQKIMLVASIHSGEIVVDGKNESLKKLKSYLSYAECNGISRNDSSDISEIINNDDSNVVDDIYLALTEAGYNVCRAVGRSEIRIDLAVVDDNHPNGFLLGIEVDGKSYQKHFTARDRDRVRREILEGRFQWKIYRIWSKEWFHDRDLQLDKLLRYVENLQKQP